MTCQKTLFNISFVVAAVCLLLCQAATIPVEESPNSREGRFYGTGIANAQTVAVANAGASGLGYGGYPGYGMGGANAFAAANANAGAFGK